MTSAASGLLGTHVPGHTWLHRLGAGTKLVGLVLASVVVVVLHGPYAALAGLGVAALVLLSSGAPLGPTLRGLRWVTLMALLLGVFQAWYAGWPRAVEVVADLLALVLLATTVTVTTPVDEVLDAVVRVLRPLRRIGVDPETVGLAISLMLRAIPHTMAIAEETRDAALSRGLERDPRARLVPFVLRVVAHARATGDALHARGIGDSAAEPSHTTEENR